MIKNNKGFGIVESILLCGFLVFLVIPAFSVITEKVYLKYSIHKINELADTAIMSSVFNIDTMEFSKGDLVFSDEDEIENNVLTVLNMNSYENMDIMSFDMSVHNKGEICPSGCTSEFDFVHLLMKISLERYGSKNPVEFWIHRDLEFPYDR